ncbi:type II toxin-antitoxin system VapC family toxin [Serpentinimonas barnesii]|uniref:type II toxin-antitoxin system VapC family toxin n=1 Tax=Serpentinimonas barnesii TaxID=1458427 RepID=UPI0004972CA3|nr:type II toxin-antitoxin system VapC family toxin [Serpentinimonas barnesii]
MDSLYLLDTNTVIYLQRGVPGVQERLAAAGRQRVALPALVVAELAYGVEKSAQQVRNRARLEQLLLEMRVLPWTHSAMWHYARHFHALRQSGQPIGHMDLLIAAQTLAENATLVTHNTREFERIEGLKLENWAGA